MTNPNVTFEYWNDAMVGVVFACEMIFARSVQFSWRSNSVRTGPFIPIDSEWPLAYTINSFERMLQIRFRPLLLYLFLITNFYLNFRTHSIY